MFAPITNEQNQLVESKLEFLDSLVQFGLLVIPETNEPIPIFRADLNKNSSKSNQVSYGLKEGEIYIVSD